MDKVIQTNILLTSGSKVKIQGGTNTESSSSLINLYPSSLIPIFIMYYVCMYVFK